MSPLADGSLWFYTDSHLWLSTPVSSLSLSAAQECMLVLISSALGRASQLSSQLSCSPLSFFLIRACLLTDEWWPHTSVPTVIERHSP